MPLSAFKKAAGAKSAPVQPDDEGKPKRIGELLIDANLISTPQLKEALLTQKKQGGKTGEILLSLGYIDVKSFAGFLAKQPGVASIDLSNYEISRELLDLISREFAIEHDVFPIDRLGSLLTVAMACPLDSKTIKQLEEQTDLRVKALLCPIDDIQVVIDRYYPAQEAPVVTPSVEDTAKHLEGALRLENAARLIRQVGSLPALPDTVQRVQQAIEDPDVSIHDIVDIINTDPPVVAKILSVANSAAYGFPNRVDSVALAATLLGMNETCNLMMSLAVMDTLGAEQREFWTKSMACANVATALAASQDKAVRTGVYTAALLHDIGRMALWQTAAQQYEKVDKTLVGAALIAAEQECIGITHTEAGFELATNWGLPIEIAEPIRFHHDFGYAEEAKTLTALVSVASTIINYASKGEIDPLVLRENCAEALAFLKLDPESLPEMDLQGMQEESLP